MTDIVGPVVGGLVGAVGTIGVTVLNHYLSNKTPTDSFVQDYKIFHVKALHLTDGTTAASPIYSTNVERINEVVPVYDEFHCLTINVFHKEQRQFNWRNVSKGVVDCQILYPWEKLETLDEITASSRNMMSGIIKKQSKVYCVRSVRFNGFQPGNTSQAMVMEVNTKEARLIIDVSSIPNFSLIFIEKPKGVLIRSGDKKDKKLEVQGELASGIFEISATDLKQDEIIKMDFVLDWNAAKRI